MTTPAHNVRRSSAGAKEDSSLPDKRDEDLSSQGGPAVNTKPRSKRIYVLWAIALTLLLALGLFSWLVVVPVWRVDTLLKNAVSKGLGGSRGYSMAEPYVPSKCDRLALGVVTELGGDADAVRNLRLYLNVPYVEARNRVAAIQVLAHCGRPASVPIPRRPGGHFQNCHHFLGGASSGGTSSSSRC